MRHKHQQRQRRWLHSLVLLVLAASAGRTDAQDNAGWGLEREDPLWTLYVPQLKYIKTDAEADRSSFRSPSRSGQDTTRLSVSPAVGVGWNNYVYHPYLLNYALLFEPGYEWTQSGYNGGDFQTEQLLLNGSGVVSLLSAKPYATTVSFGRAHQDVQSDFFSSETADTQSLGVFTGYHAGPIPITLTFDQMQEDRSGYSSEFLTELNKIGLHATNERHRKDTTDFNYQYNLYNNESHGANASYASETSSHHVIMTDAEHFRRSSLFSSVYFTERESRGSASSDLNASCNFNLEHTPHLRSYYTYSFGDNFGDGYSSTQNNALAGINHQLYESLDSHFEVNGAYGSSESGNSSQDSTSYGLAGGLNYNKRLGDWAHLSVGNDASYSLTDQHATGSEQTIPDESHAIPAVGPLIIRLNTPRVIAITSITKNNIPLDSSEWTANTGTDPWQIQFFTGGAHSITNGDNVAVTYIAQANPSGSYSVFNYSGQVELRFWNDRAGIHAGYSLTRNGADTAGFILQDTEEYQAGADVGYRGLQLGANYTDQHSSFYSYQNIALSENYSMPVFSHSTVGINCNQQWSIYPSDGGTTTTNQAQNLAFYSYMLHYDWHPEGRFSLNTEAGLQQERGGQNDQDLFAARIYMDWSINKLEIHLGYQHENQQFSNETRERDYVFLRMRRNF